MGIDGPSTMGIDATMDLDTSIHRGPWTASNFDMDSNFDMHETAFNMDNSLQDMDDSNFDMDETASNIDNSLQDMDDGLRRTWTLPTWIASKE